MNITTNNISVIDWVCGVNSVSHDEFDEILHQLIEEDNDLQDEYPGTACGLIEVFYPHVFHALFWQDVNGLEFQAMEIIDNPSSDWFKSQLEDKESALHDLINKMSICSNAWVRSERLEAAKRRFNAA